jgi:ADP-ribose pyrophosphatase YjhB (NUDIX family)
VVFYDPKVAAVCVIARDGRVLMIRRGTDLGYGLWSLPGGFVDRGEVVESAAAREAWEETGLQVAVDALIGLFSLSGDPVIVAAYTGHETGGTLAPGPEALETGFFALDSLPELAFVRDTEILARWKSQLPISDSSG